MLDKLAKHQVRDIDKAVMQLTIGVDFCACRSYEYSKIPRREQKRKKTIVSQKYLLFQKWVIAWPLHSKCKKIS
jgi:hypothetical protein